MNPTEPKPQTPLTDAFYRSLCLKGDAHWNTEEVNALADFARSLELKLQEVQAAKDKLWSEYCAASKESGDNYMTLVKEAERQRDEARAGVDEMKEWCKAQRHLYDLAISNQESWMRKWDASQAELTQLRKVCDELAQFGEGLNDSLDDYLHLLAGHDRTCDCDRCETWRAYIKALTNYSTLPHVIKAKDKLVGDAFVVGQFNTKGNKQ